MVSEEARKKKREDGEEGVGSQSCPDLPVEVVCRVLEGLQDARDLFAAWQVCRTWRAAISSTPHLLATFTLHDDDDKVPLDGTATSPVRPPSPARPRLPIHNVGAYSRRKNGNPISPWARSPCIVVAGYPFEPIGDLMGSPLNPQQTTSPRTPSPTRSDSREGAPLSSLREALLNTYVPFARVVGEFVLSSDRISDDDIHLILKSSPALRSLVLHVNGPEYLSSSALLDIDKTSVIMPDTVLPLSQYCDYEHPYDIEASGEHLGAPCVTQEPIHAVSQFAIHSLRGFEPADNSIKGLLRCSPAPPLSALHLEPCHLSADALGELVYLLQDSLRALSLQYDRPVSSECVSCIARLSSKLDALSIGPLTDSGLLAFASVTFPRLARLRISLSIPRRPDRQRVKDIMENCPMVSSMHILWGVRQYAYGQTSVGEDHICRSALAKREDRHIPVARSAFV